MLRRLFIVFILISTFAVAGCKISGTITTEDGVGVGGVIVYLDGEGEDGNASIMAITDADGTYVFEGFHHGTLTITPEKVGYTFVPDIRTETVDFFESLLDVDFIAEEPPPQQPELPSEKSEVPWSTYQGNAAHTGYVPVYLNTNEFSESWTRNMFEVAGLDPDMPEDAALYPVAAGDGKVFVTTGDDYGPQVAMALDSTTGDTKWTHDFGESDPDDPTYILPPAYANFRVYIQSAGNGDSFLWTFDAASGDVIFNPPPAYGSQYDLYYAPTIYGDKVYIGGGEYGGVYEFNDVTGVESWFVKLTQSNQWTPAVDEERVIAYNGYYRYGAVENSPPELTVINRSSGLEEFTIPDLNFEFNRGIMNLAPVLGSEDNVIVINGGRLISFDLTVRRISWETRGEKDNIVEGFIGQPSLANGTIYAFYEGSLHARNESDGSFLWEWKLPVESEDGNEDGNDDEEDSNVPFPMIVTDNLIFVSTASKTYAVDLESQTDVWSYGAEGHLALSNDGILFIATTEGELHAIFTSEQF